MNAAFSKLWDQFRYIDELFLYVVFTYITIPISVVFDSEMEGSLATLLSMQSLNTPLSSPVLCSLRLGSNGRT